MNRRIIVVITTALLVSALAVPLTLHELDLRHIRDSTFSAVRYAAIADPTQLSQLPVSHWEEVEGVATPSVRRRSWGKYEMHILRTTTTVVADVDLRPTLAALLLGAGGWLRVAVCLVVGGSLLYAGLRHPNSAAKKNSTYPAASYVTAQNTYTQAPLSLLKASMERVAFPSLVLDPDHRLVLWNAAIQKDAPHASWSPDLHLLDLAALLPWGKQLIEAVDEHALHEDVDPAELLFITKEGDRICVTAG